jgi:hypothetical protein
MIARVFIARGEEPLPAYMSAMHTQAMLEVSVHKSMPAGEGCMITRQTSNKNRRQVGGCTISPQGNIGCALHGPYRCDSNPQVHLVSRGLVLDSDSSFMISPTEQSSVEMGDVTATAARCAFYEADAAAGWDACEQRCRRRIQRLFDWLPNLPAVMGCLQSTRTIIQYEPLVSTG